MIRNSRANEYAANLCQANEEQIGLKIANLEKEIEALKRRIDFSNPKSEVYKQELAAQREFQAMLADTIIRFARIRKEFGHG